MQHPGAAADIAILDELSLGPWIDADFEFLCAIRARELDRVVHARYTGGARTGLLPVRMSSIRWFAVSRQPSSERM